MSLLVDPTTEPPRPFRGGLIIIVIGVAVLAAGAAYYLLTTEDAEPVVAEDARPSPRPRVVESDPPPVSDPAPPVEPASEPEPEIEVAAASELEPAASAAPAVVLRVTSDVDGASVFVDRRFVGTTPFEGTDIAPGPHRLNVSAPGYDGHAQDIEVGGDPLDVVVHFREVRLDQTVPVVHKHRIGSCEGRLVATVDGIRYETSDDDAFRLPFDRIEAFTIDYMAHTLTLEERDGRTYNFTDRKANADQLFVFHREVEKARERLAAQN